ncbi:ABC transporter ATP-binding protein [Bacillus sp. TS-2]|nr:ABC transporter ATP-binding protein [Bacillus sp. TS-2]
MELDELYLELKGVEKIEGNKVWFSPIDLQIKKGQIVAIQCERELGRILIEMMTREGTPSAGQVIYFEQPQANTKNLSQDIGYSLLLEGLYDKLTPYDYLKFFSGVYGASTDIDSILTKFNLLYVKKKRIKNLNLSETKRLLWAKAFVHNPKLVILEEPDQNIDLESKLILQRVLTEMSQAGMAILMVTSNMESAVILSNVVYRLSSDGLKELDLIEENKGSANNEAQTTKESLEGEEASSLQHQIERIPAKVEDKVILFDPTEIDYIESLDGMAQLHVKGESFPCTLTLNQLMERLEPFGFFRCHRSYIVNLQKVREVISWTRNSYSLNLDDKKRSTIPLSKGNLPDLKRILRM